ERDLAQTYLDVAGFMFIRLNDKGIVTLINKKGCEILGHDSKDVIGKKWIDVFVPECYRAKTERTFNRLKEGDIAATEYFENPVIGKGGEERLIAWHNLVLHDKEGAIIGTLSSGEDITERKRKEEELRQMGEKLSLLSNVTRHDILNEVTIQMGYLDLIRNRTTDTETMALIEKARFATGTIRSQIEFTKVYQGTGILAPKWQDINAIVSSLMVPKGIELSLGCPEIEVLADPMLSLVFCNLLDNLIRHGEHATSLKVSCSRNDTGLSIVWEDNGVGVPDEKKELIFSRGFGKNTGMGLFLIRQILSITGISIVENGVEGKGARFEILVPLNGFRCKEAMLTAGQEDQRRMMKSSGSTRHK
ncbi:MAG: PAS domain-containing sensor histidine kinase, partial [Methanomassiliicoccales archaeon]|nr:PAS domain-containing sensor histidine kinase [Methanomassiliicoccales archaeon]